MRYNGILAEKIIKPVIRKTNMLIPDKIYIKIRYKAITGKTLNLNHPKTYNEKLNWMKLYDRNPLYSKIVDKYEVKDYVKKAIGDKYVIPTLGLWDSIEKIDFDKLPEQFVLKGTHDGGSIVICKDKSTFDKDNAIKVLTKSLNTNYYWHGREWPYKNVKPRIIAEPYLEDSETGELRDYKFFCFDGKVKAMFIASDRQKKDEEVKFDFFDANGKHLDVRQGHENAKIEPKLPANFEKMKQLSAVLSKGFPQIRVDFYEMNGEIYFGELTLFHFDGMIPFEPEEWDKIFGEWICLPDNTKR